MKGGYSILRHDAIRDTEALLMKEAGCKDIQIEPHLLPVDNSLYKHETNTDHGARLDVSARGIYGTFERTFIDIRVTHPNCPSNVFKPIANIYREHEHSKKAEYEERILQSEKASFIPLVFTTLGGMAPACHKMNQKLAEKIADKKNEKYAAVINHVRTRLRFSLLRGILVSLTGDRGKLQTHKGDETLENVSFNIIPEAPSYETP